MKITEKIFDVQTGKETILDREETVSEVAARKAAEAELLELQIKQAETETKKAPALAKLAALGLTLDDLKVLGF